MTPQIPPPATTPHQATKNLCTYLASLILTAAACMLLATTH